MERITLPSQVLIRYVTALERTAPKSSAGNSDLIRILGGTKSTSSLGFNSLWQQGEKKI